MMVDFHQTFVITVCLVSRDKADLVRLWGHRSRSRCQWHAASSSNFICQ